MRVHSSKLSQSQGSVLFIAIIICGILAVLIGSYLSLIQNQHLSVVRAQSWNGALVVAEAGVEEAMAHLNSGVQVANLAVNGWTNVVGSPGEYIKTNRTATGYSVVTIQTPPAVSGEPVVISAGHVPGPLSRPELVRTVKVQTSTMTGQLMPGAMVVSTSVNFNGQGITTDSFNSMDTNHSGPGGTYVASKALDHGDVCSLSTSNGAVQISNGTIKGTVHTAAGGTLDTGNGGTVSVGPNGTVGDFGWVTNSSGMGKVQNGHFKDDVNFTFPDATMPDTKGKVFLTPVAGNYKINGVTYKYLLNASNPWKLATLDGGVYINGTGVILWVTDAVALGGNKQEVRISSTNNSLSLYVGKTNAGAAVATADLSGGGVVNETGIARNFNYYGLPSNTGAAALKLGANAAFVGRIYAPRADYVLSGGGNNTYDFVGQSITRSASMSGHFNFHYDEGSPLGQAINGYRVVSWDEL